MWEWLWWGPWWELAPSSIRIVYIPGNRKIINIKNFALILERIYEVSDDEQFPKDMDVIACLRYDIETLV